MRGLCFAVALATAFVAWAGPQEDFDAAVKAGLPLSAEAAYRKLTVSGKPTSAARHLQAARMAWICGKTSVCNDRLALFLRTEKGWSADVETALWGLCATGSDVDLFKRLATGVKPSTRLWVVGSGLMDRLAAQNRPKELIRLADVLLGRFSLPKRRERVLHTLYENARSASMDAYPKQELVDLVLAHKNLGRLGAFSYLLLYGNQRTAFPRDFGLQYAVAHGDVADGRLAEAILSLDENGIDSVKDAAKASARDRTLGLVKKVEALCFDGRHPRAALAFARVAGQRLPAYLLADYTKGRPSPALRKAFDRIASFADYAKDPVFRHDVAVLRDQFVGAKLLTDADDSAFKAADAKYPVVAPALADLLKEMRETKDAAKRNAAFEKALAQVDPRSFWDWRTLFDTANKINTKPAKFAVHKAYGDARTAYAWDLSWCFPDRGATEPFGAIDFAKVPPGAAFNYLRNTYGNLKAGAGRDKFYFDFLTAQPLTSNVVDAVGWALSTAAGRLDDAAFLKAFPLDHVLKGLTSSTRLEYGASVYLDTLRVARAAGRFEPTLAAYVTWANALADPAQRFQALFWPLMWNVCLPNKEGKGTHWEWLVLDEAATADLLTKATAAAKAVAPAQAQTLSISLGWGGWSHLRELRAAAVRRDGAKAAFGATLDAFEDAFVDLQLAGLRFNDALSCLAPGLHRRLSRLVKEGKTAALAPVARFAGASLGTDLVGGQDAVIDGYMAKLKSAGNDEAYYLYLDSVPSDTYPRVISAAAKFRGEVSSKLPGIYPVGEDDPAYPLYVAADELTKRNPEQAWQILQEPKNQSVFEREAVNLPQTFTAWAVNQLRMARGEKDALLVKARNIATAVLAQEAKISPELAAAMILTRAECYRDQQNFEAAKLEYQSVRDNPAYHATKYGKKAMFRAVDLQIASGNAQAVEPTLEYWLSQNDRDVQAEAHYFLAKIAFDRKDYDETIKQLRQVFAINFTHTEARFLQGEWKLATNSEVDDTDVLIGDLSERSLIRPGNQLTITVQDANLSVAGGGASIPVIVESAPGGDRERVNLYPTSRDPSTFKGQVEIRLGAAKPSNLALEVGGNDTISYAIEPSFLAARGLPLNEPKRLRVIDDAKLAVGAGAPRTEEKKTEDALKDLLEDADGPEGAAVARKLRPGNPLYILVQDRDCSLGGANDAVSVTVETSSGDRLDCMLKEEKPFSGVFRGRVETALPPPRAYASDTAAGFNPGDVINKSRNGGWKSQSDGQPGKWFAVDMMGSHPFSEVTLETPSASDVKAIRLVGRMGSKETVLARLPAAEEKTKFRLRRQQQYDRTFRRSLSRLAAFCQTDKAAKPWIVENISFRVMQNHSRGEWQSAYYRGPCAIPEGVSSLRLRVNPLSSSKMALRDLWLSLAIDGEEVFSGQGCKLQGALLTADVTPGCHVFELGVYANTHEDDFELQYVTDEGEDAEFPARWFDEEKNPSLRKFVRDVATISRTPEGFKAAFATPQRLRALRWEFADVKSPAVAVTRMRAKDASGDEVLPVASDFSDASSNRTLEVAPGDRISVRYVDERTSSGEKKVVQREIESSFNDGRLRFIFEDTDSRGNLVDCDAFRFQPGDALVLALSDPDCDVTDEPDKVKISIRTSPGKSYTKTLVEYVPRWLRGRTDNSSGMHSGVFMGLVRTCREGDTTQPPNVLRVRDDEMLTAIYEDRENTDPGVPCERRAKIFAARPAQPQLTLFKVAKTREVDDSPDAKVRLERIRRRPGNENVACVYRDVLTAEPMSAKELAGDEPVPVAMAEAIPVRVTDRSRARYAGSKILVEAVAESELARAEAEGRDAERVTVPLVLGGGLGPFRQRRGAMSAREAQAAGVFNGVIRLSLGPIDPNVEVAEDAPPVLSVNGSDTVRISVLSEAGEVVLTRRLKLVSNAALSLTDSSFAAERTTAHVGESFFVAVDDADRDVSDDPDTVEAEAVSLKTGLRRPLTLTETMPHSGVFTGRLRPVMFAPGETIPNVATGGVASANEILTEDRFAVGYGDSVVFRYRDPLVLPGADSSELAATGTVFRGSNGDVRLFSKRFADRDAAVLVQFRLAECLFEQAKEHRKLKQPEKSAAAIAEGRAILDEALKNYPDSSYVVQGEYLLANLYQELANEQKEAGDMEKATPLYQAALNRFSQILGTWPEGEYAARSQYHKALCLEMLKDFSRASEEYVKMTYLYPESELVGEATIRLATYYYTQEKRFDISGHIYRNFQQRFPQHGKAARALFMAGSCYIKQAEALSAAADKAAAEKVSAAAEMKVRAAGFLQDAQKTFDELIETYRDGAPALRAQAMYWAGDVAVRRRDYAKAYHYLKQAVFEYPETEWARRARGLLLQEERSFKEFQ